MKKFLPIIIVGMCFSGFLSIQVLWDVFHVNAQQVGKLDSKNQLYESLFQKLAIESTDKKKIVLNQIGQKIVVLNFWASWCTPCLKELPTLSQFATKYQSQVQVIGINGDEEDPLVAIKKVSEKYKINFPQIADPKSLVSDQFLVTALPYTIVFKNGKVVFVSNKEHNFMGENFIKELGL